MHEQWEMMEESMGFAPASQSHSCLTCGTVFDPTVAHLARCPGCGLHWLDPGPRYNPPSQAERAKAKRGAERRLGSGVDRANLQARRATDKRILRQLLVDFVPPDAGLGDALARLDRLAGDTGG